MQQAFFIQTNNKQMLGALVSQHSIQSKLKETSHTNVTILNVDDMEHFKEFDGTNYLFTPTETRRYSKTDLQSFTLSRFMPPKIMNYEGVAVVIDPDIFALSNVEELFNLPDEEHALWACTKKGAWDTSVMVLNCAQLRHWDITDLLTRLRDKELTYTDLITLRSEKGPIEELSRIWNELDAFTTETKMTHMTGRLTQPWKTGLPIDFTRNRMKKILGVIPREPILKLLGKYPSHYLQHPHKEVGELFFKLAKSALADGAITEEFILKEIEAGHVRPDLLIRVTSV
jgi:hypothetical protein